MEEKNIQKVQNWAKISNLVQMMIFMDKNEDEIRMLVMQINDNQANLSCFSLSSVHLEILL